MAYNDKIIIQESTETRDTYGEVDTTWATYKTVWAQIDDASSGLNYQSDMPVFSTTKIFIIHKPDAPDVTSKMRISFDGQIFEIMGIQRKGRLQWVIMAEAYDDE